MSRELRWVALRNAPGSLGKRGDRSDRLRSLPGRARRHHACDVQHHEIGELQLLSYSPYQAEHVIRRQVIHTLCLTGPEVVQCDDLVSFIEKFPHEMSSKKSSALQPG